MYAYIILYRTFENQTQPPHPINILPFNGKAS